MTTTTRLTHRLELRQRMYVQSRTRRWALWVSLVLTTLVVVAAMALILYNSSKLRPTRPLWSTRFSIGWPAARWIH